MKLKTRNLKFGEKHFDFIPSNFRFLIFIFLSFCLSPAYAQPDATITVTVSLLSTNQPSTVNLGLCDGFVILAATAVSTGPGIINGDVGLSPGVGLGITGVLQVNGTIYAVDADGPSGSVSNPVLLAAAQNDLTTAYTNAAGRPVNSTVAAELGGTTRTSGVYNSASGMFGITGILTLDAVGNPSSVWIFQMATTLTTADGTPGNPASRVILANGAQASNIFWQVGSSATLGTYSVFKGTIMAQESITMGGGSTTDGRALARTGAITFNGASGNLPILTNNAPVAVDDSASTPENTPVVINVLMNDTDSDTNALTVDSVTQGSNGTVTINGGLTNVTYTPKTSRSGVDSFTYIVSDGKGGTDVGSVRVVVGSRVINDFGGDGRTDLCIYDDVGQSIPGLWCFSKTTDGNSSNYFGYAGTVPVSGYFDSDNTSDYGVYDAVGIPGLALPGSWYLMKSTDGFEIQTLGYEDADAVAGHGVVVY